MIRARLSRMATGHILATFKTGNEIMSTRVVGGPNDKLGDAAEHVIANFTVDQVGLKASDIGPACVMTYGATVWLNPGFKRGNH